MPRARIPELEPVAQPPALPVAPAPLAPTLAPPSPAASPTPASVPAETIGGVSVAQAVAIATAAPAPAPAPAPPEPAVVAAVNVPATATGETIGGVPLAQALAIVAAAGKAPPPPEPIAPPPDMSGTIPVPDRPVPLAPGQKGLTDQAFRHLPPDDQTDVAVTALTSQDFRGLPESALALARTPLVQQAAGAGGNVPPPGPRRPAGKRNPATSLGPFAGVGIFTGDQPFTAEQARGGVDWIAMQAEVGDTGEAARLRNRGYRILVWESSPGEGQGAVARFGAAGYIAQAEGPAQLARALALEGDLRVPKALVTNFELGQEYPVDWVCIPEAYVPSNPVATVRNLYNRARQVGATVIAPVIGVYDDERTGTHHYATEYQDDLLALRLTSFSVWVANTMAPQDFAWLATRIAQAAPPASPSGGGTTSPGSSVPPDARPAPTPTVPPVVAPGATLPGATRTPTTPRPAGVQAAWQRWIAFHATAVPARHAAVKSIADSLERVFR